MKTLLSNKEIRKQAVSYFVLYTAVFFLVSVLKLCITGAASDVMLTTLALKSICMGMFAAAAYVMCRTIKIYNTIRFAF